MDISKIYSKRIGKIFKANHDKDLSFFKDEFKPVFIDCMRDLPEDIAEEMFNKFVIYSERDFKDGLYNLINLFELFEENYDIENDPFSKEEWDYIKLIVNDCSDDIDMEVIKYIMQVLLDLDHL